MRLPISKLNKTFSNNLLADFLLRRDQIRAAVSFWVARSVLQLKPNESRCFVCVRHQVTCNPFYRFRSYLISIPMGMPLLNCFSLLMDVNATSTPLICIQPIPFVQSVLFASYFTTIIDLQLFGFKYTQSRYWKCTGVKEKSQRC